MEAQLSHLPVDKQNEILEILEIIKEEAKPEKVILFGSHTGTKWVEDDYFEDGIRYSYISDYDFLVVTHNNDEKEHAIISHIENRTQHYKNVVSPIVHDIEYINQGLRFGQYFFTDIINEGIVLYDSEKVKFDSPKILTPREEQEKAQDYFDIWYPYGGEFLIDAMNCYERASYKKGAFELHQATECFYNAALLVFTGYKPKTHNLENLRNYSKYLSPELHSIFLLPNSDDTEKHLFDLLRRGYIDARYKTDYIITKDELKALIEKISIMQEIVKSICEEKIENLGLV